MTKVLANILLLMPLALMARGISVNTVPVDTAYAATSVNVAVFRANSVVTSGGRQYIAYYDRDGYVTIARRELDSLRWEIERSPYRGRVEDAHNVISIMVDGNDVLHASFDHHGDSLRYCRAIAPGSLTLGPLEQMTGSLEQDVTYPEFYRLDDGNLLFVYRSGASGRGNLVMNRYDTATGRWTRLHDTLIDGENERNAYWQLCVDPAGTIHLSWVWRETWMVETNHDLCYACSHDGGLTWQRSDGTPYSLPISISTAEIAWSIPQSSELINQTSMSTDNLGNPYIATYWREDGDTVPQYRLVWHDGTTWRQRAVSRRTTPFSLAGGGTKMIPISRPRMVIDGSELIYITRDAERDSRVTLYTGRLDSDEFEIADVTDYSVGAWEPTYDTELWKQSGRLHLYVQPAGQGDGERVSDYAPQPLSIIEITSSQPTCGR